MQLMTEAIKAALPPLYSTDDVPLKDKIVICKFFTLGSNWSWFVFEGKAEKQDDITFFGMVHGREREMGYFTLFELQSVPTTFGWIMIRDLRVFKVPYGELIAGGK